MWRRVRLEVWLPSPPARVFALFADPVRWPDFAPAVVFRQRIDDGPVTVGSRWWAVDRILGPFTVRFADELEAIDPPRSVVWHSTSPWNSRVEYVCTPEGGGTRVVADYAGDVAGGLRLVALLPTFVLEAVLMRDFRGMARLLHAEEGRRSLLHDADTSSPGADRGGDGVVSASAPVPPTR